MERLHPMELVGEPVGVGNTIIKVVGVGGAGGNALNNMMRNLLEGVDFVAVNTDQRALELNDAARKVQIGGDLTRGLGAGANPEKGWHAAMESRTEIARYLEGADMVFVTAGMGGGTGTGAAPVVAELAREAGALTVGVVSKPFQFEGKQRMVNADKGLEALRERVDSLIVIPNEKLLAIADRNMSLLDAFREADNVLYDAVKGICDLITITGEINLDFADVRTVMNCQGMALMGRGVGEGQEKVVDAVRQAISSPLLEDTAIDGAQGILISITGGEDLGIVEIDEAIRHVQEAAHPSANIIWGMVIDPDLRDETHITVVATGFDRIDQRPGAVDEVGVSVSQSQGTMAPPEPPPLEVPAPPQAFATMHAAIQPAMMARSGAAPADMGASTKAKPWKSGGRSLSDVLSEGGRRKSPFAMVADSEFGPRGYPGSKS